MINWHNIKEIPINKDTTYLVMVRVGKHYVYDLARWSNDLHSVDKYNFEKDAGAGFYGWSSEWGYVRTRDVVLWSELPEIPECFELID